jgi:hypothetical protein
MSRGYLFYAIGDYFLDEAITLTKSIQKYGEDDYPISLVVNEKGADRADKTGLFDKLLVFDESPEIFKSVKLPHEKYGILATFEMAQHAPYDETMVTDTDVLCTSSTKPAWDAMTSLDQAFTMVGRNVSPNWHFGYNHELSKKHGYNFPETHAGCTLVKKNHSDVNKFQHLLIDAWNNYHELGFKSIFRGGRCQEIHYSYAFANLNYKVIEFGEHPVMTFNYPPDIKLPNKKQLVENNKELYDYIPFVHMFKKHRQDYFKLVKRLL